MKFHSPSSKLL